jgi:predicted permease
LTATAVGALLIILAGMVIRRLGIASPKDGPLLVRLVISVFMPALILVILVRADLSAALLLVPLAGWIVFVAMLGLCVGLARALRLEGPRAGAFVVAGAVGNTGFFGLPLIAASGSGFSQAAAVMYDALCTGIVTWTATPALSRGYSGAGPRLEWRALLRVLALPPTWALAVGVLLNLAGVDLPDVIDRPLEILAGAVLPLVMIYAGLLLEVGVLRRAWAQVGAITVVRLVLAALVGLAVGALLGLAGATLHTVVLLSAMPTAMMSLVLGTQFGLRSELIAGAVATTTLLATLTLPAIRAILV